MAHLLSSSVRSLLRKVSSNLVFVFVGSVNRKENIAFCRKESQIRSLLLSTVLSEVLFDLGFFQFSTREKNLSINLFVLSISLSLLNTNDTIILTHPKWIKFQRTDTYRILCHQNRHPFRDDPPRNSCRPGS